MKEWIKQAEDWVEKNPYQAGYMVGMTVGVTSMLGGFWIGQKVLIYKIQLSQKKHGI